MKRGDELDLRVERYGAEGKGVSRVDGFVVFVRGGVPGDNVRGRLARVSKNFAEADIAAVVTPSTHRVAPRCRYFGTCGGCVWQHLAYPGQLEFKRQQVADALERIGGFPGGVVEPTIGAGDPFYYRNKMEFSFGVRWLTREELDAAQGRDGTESPLQRFALGLHIPQRFDRVLDIHECYLQSTESAAIVNAVREFSLAHELTIYSTLTHTGYLRNLVIREGRHTGDRMVNLVTSEDRPELMRAFSEMVHTRFPSVTTIINNITTRKSQVAIGDREVVLYGPGFIRERIGSRSYKVSANSFFQTNTLQAERLYDTARQMAGLQPADTVFDLYSGTGTIALHVAADAAAVVGIESVPDAVADAQRNASEQGVTNCTFILGDLKEKLVDDTGWLAQHSAPTVMIIDPPRAGMHPKVVERIRQMHPGRIVYVSCNPATQARDLKSLCAEGAYTIDKVQPVDMFPHTMHVENIVRLIAQ
jgi:23S rRNA (uracil1939-C5)-methyltransferase